MFVTWVTSAENPVSTLITESELFGPIDRYIREMLLQLPRQQNIAFFTDVTH